MKKYEKLIVAITFIGVWYLLLSVVYYAYWPIKIVEFDRPGTIELSKTVVKQGDVLPIKYPFTKFKDIVPTIHTRLVDGISYPLLTTYGSAHVGRYDDWWYTLQIPQNMPPGIYRIERTIIYPLPYDNQRVFNLISPKFEVVK
jgi:hypothetical protein